MKYLGGVNMTSPYLEPFIAGLETLWAYVAAHVVFCLIPAFFIAGAIAALVKKDVILQYFGSNVKPWISYSIASVSGTILAVCSCTILPVFMGLYKKGAGIGPATAFLYSGPAINVLAIVYTAQLLGWDLGLARAVSAIFLSVVIGSAMAFIFRKEEKNLRKQKKKTKLTSGPGTSEETKPNWVILLFFSFLVAILVIGTTAIALWIRLSIIYILTIGIFVLILKYFNKDELTDWGSETWDLTKKIFPILLAGAFFVGFIAYFLPSETFRPYLGGNSLSSCLLASVLGGLLYMPTLLEVPIIGTTLGYSSGVMGGGPALSLLLSGPAVSLPSMLVLYRLIGAKKAAAYIILVIFTAAIAGFIYGQIIG